MISDSERCRILCELIDAERNSKRAEILTRILWQLLDKQQFPVPESLHWRPVN